MSHNSLGFPIIDLFPCVLVRCCCAEVSGGIESPQILVHRIIPVVTAVVFWVFEDLSVVRLPYLSDEWSRHVLPDQFSKTPRILSILSIFCGKEILSICSVTSIAHNFLSSSEREFVYTLVDYPFQSLSSWRPCSISFSTWSYLRFICGKKVSEVDLLHDLTNL